MKKIMMKFIMLIILWGIICNSVKIRIKLGEIEGTKEISRDGRFYYSFTAIPYAKPPVGILRFQNPEKAEPWQGVLDARKQAPPCTQVPIYLSHLRNITIGQEDCLYLNVYTPQISSERKLPVLAYIHGGGFRCGMTGQKYSANYFMDEDIVLVTLHYRVGTLGFLSFENEVISGNYGLKDQSEALRWIKANIEDFGGDPNSLTIFGESAGAASAHFHMMSPRSKGLLKGVISESGVVNQFWSYGAPGTARSLANKVATKFNCQDKKGEKLLKCLQAIDAKELIREELNFLFWDFNPIVVFRPVREPSGEGAFLDFDPLTTVTDLPWIVGIVEDEGNIFRAALMKQDSSVTQQFIDNSKEFIRQKLYRENISSEDESINLIRKKYFREPMTVESLQEDLVNFTTDCYFLYPMEEAVKRHKGPVYKYLYNYRAAASFSDSYLPKLNLGSSHADELLLLLNLTGHHIPEISSKDVVISKKMVKMWANFAKFSNPSIDGINWPELHSSEGEYLKLSADIKTGRQFKQEITKWWTNFPLYRTTATSIRTEL